MSDRSNSAGGSALVPSLLLVLFIGLKLGHVIDWSWWWVMSPLWIPVVLTLLVLIVVGIVAVVRGGR